MSWLPKQKVIVPTDFSEESFRALDVALELSTGPEAIHVLHVLPILEPAAPGVLWTTIDEPARQRHAEEALRKRLQEPRYGGVQVVVRFGDPGREITDYAEEIGAELIVMPSHGATGLKRLLIGSVAERTVRLATCAVLVLRPDQE